MKERVRAYVSKLTFNNGLELPIEKNDIVLFVGSNNVGKSQALEDIYVKCGKNASTIVVTEIETVKEENPIKDLLDLIANCEDLGSILQYRIMGQTMNYSKDGGETYFKNLKNYDIYRDLFVARLSTQVRLTICNPVETINRNEAKTNPIQYAAFDSQYRKWLSNNFREAFGENLTPNILFGKTIPLCIGPNVENSNEPFEDEISRQEAYAEILNSYKQVQNQGDGIKSFTGILLYLMLDYYCTYLIDEPESFLHPPQARIMGQIIGRTLRDNQQAFISTHSEDIVNGLLDACDKRLKIIRITREGDTNNFSVLENQKVKEVFGDPILKYSNILKGLFHKTVVLCESDSDCRFYSVIEAYLKQCQHKYSETLFINCGGKSSMAKIANALNALNVEIRIIPDLDVLNEESVICRISEACGITWDAIKSEYKKLVSNLHSSKDTIERSYALNEIKKVIEGSDYKDLSKEEINRIKNIVKKSSKWEEIKREGVISIPLEAREAFDNLNSIFKKHGLYMVPVGELEGFVKIVDGHGSSWVNKVFEKYPDLDAEIYQTVKDFIMELNL